MKYFKVKPGYNLITGWKDSRINTNKMKTTLIILMLLALIFCLIAENSPVYAENEDGSLTREG